MDPRQLDVADEHGVAVGQLPQRPPLPHHDLRGRQRPRAQGDPGHVLCAEEDRRGGDRVRGHVGGHVPGTGINGKCYA